MKFVVSEKMFKECGQRRRPTYPISFGSGELTRGPLVAHLSDEDMLKSAVIEEKKFKNIE